MTFNLTTTHTVLGLIILVMLLPFIRMNSLDLDEKDWDESRDLYLPECEIVLAKDLQDSDYETWYAHDPYTHEPHTYSTIHEYMHCKLLEARSKNNEVVCREDIVVDVIAILYNLQHITYKFAESPAIFECLSYETKLTFPLPRLDNDWDAEFLLSLQRIPIGFFEKPLSCIFNIGTLYDSPCSQ